MQNIDGSINCSSKFLEQFLSNIPFGHWSHSVKVASGVDINLPFPQTAHVGCPVREFVDPAIYKNRRRREEWVIKKHKKKTRRKQY